MKVHPRLTRIQHASLHSGYDLESVTFGGRFYVEVVLPSVRFTEATVIERRPQPEGYVEKCLPIRRSRERKNGETETTMSCVKHLMNRTLLVTSKSTDQQGWPLDAYE